MTPGGCHPAGEGGSRSPAIPSPSTRARPEIGCPVRAPEPGWVHCRLGSSRTPGAPCAAWSCEGVRAGSDGASCVACWMEGGGGGGACLSHLDATTDNLKLTTRPSPPDSKGQGEDGRLGLAGAATPWGGSASGGAGRALCRDELVACLASTLLDVGSKPTPARPCVAASGLRRLPAPFNHHRPDSFSESVWRPCCRRISGNKSPVSNLDQPIFDPPGNVEGGLIARLSMGRGCDVLASQVYPELHG